jgi:hypothetical protein
MAQSNRSGCSLTVVARLNNKRRTAQRSPVWKPNVRSLLSMELEGSLRPSRSAPSDKPGRRHKTPWRSFQYSSYPCFSLHIFRLRCYTSLHFELNVIAFCTTCSAILTVLFSPQILFGNSSLMSTIFFWKLCSHAYWLEYKIMETCPSTRR